MGFWSETELAGLGLGSLGVDVRIDRTVQLHGRERIEIGSHVRVDAFSLISAGPGGISLGDHVHLGAYVFLAGEARIEVGDFSGLSGRTSVYSSNDDYTGAALTGPTIPDELRLIASAPVTVGRHCIVGAGSVILPGVSLGDGAAVGALTLVRKDVPEFTIVAGADCRRLGSRRRDVLDLERTLLRSEGRSAQG
jgi:galactoside O-acetyltransferase